MSSLSIESSLRATEEPKSLPLFINSSHGIPLSPKTAKRITLTIENWWINSLKNLPADFSTRKPLLPSKAKKIAVTIEKWWINRLKSFSTDYSTGKPLLPTRTKKTTLAIEQWWVHKLCQKNDKVTGGGIHKSKVRGKKFDEIVEIIKSKDLINATSKFIKHIDGLCEFKPKNVEKVAETFISAFLFTQAPVDTLDIMNEKELEFLKVAEQFVKSYEKLLKTLWPNKPLYSEKFYVAYIEFRELRVKYFEAFSERQAQHRVRMLKGLMSTYVNLAMRKNSLAEQTMVRREKAVYNAMTTSQKRIKNAIYEFSGNKGLDLLSGFVQVQGLAQDKAIDNILSNATLREHYEVATNPNFQFPPKPSNVNELEARTKLAVESNPIDFKYIVRCLLEFRDEIIKLIPENKQIVSALYTILNHKVLESIDLQNSDSELFFRYFFALTNIIRSIESKEHNPETDKWVTDTVMKVQSGASPLELIPGIFKTLKEKILQIQQEIKNAHLRANRLSWMSEAKRYILDYYNKSLAVFELNLQKTNSWIKTKLAEGQLSGLTKEMLLSKNVSGHFLITALVDYATSLGFKQDTFPETLKLIKPELETVRTQINQILKQGIAIDLFRHIIMLENCQFSTDDLTKLKNRLESVVFVVDLEATSKIILEEIDQCLLKQEVILSNEKREIYKTIIINSHSFEHKIYQLTRRKFKDALKHYLYKGELPIEYKNHCVFSLYPEIETYALQLHKIIKFNFVFHESRYISLIRKNQNEKLFDSLRSTRKYDPKTNLDLFTSESDEISETHKKIKKIAQFCTGITMINFFSTLPADENFVVLSDEQYKAFNESKIGQVIGEERNIHYRPFNDDEVLEIIEKEKINHLIKADIKPSEMHKALVRIFSEIQGKNQISDDNEAVQVVLKNLKRISFSNNPFCVTFHRQIMDIVTKQETLQGIRDNPPNNLLKFFIDQLQEIGASLHGSIEKAYKKPKKHLDDAPLFEHHKIRTGMVPKALCEIK